MSMLKINDIEYRLHPVFNLFGADKNGNIIDVTKMALLSDIKNEKIKVRGCLMARVKSYRLLVFIWESYNGIKPRNLNVKRKDEDESNNCIDNLILVKRTLKNRLSPEDRAKKLKEKIEIWRKSEWVCPDCGFKTTNNSSRYHQRVCGDENKQRRIYNGTRWIDRNFDCHFCGKSYKNSYRYLHLKSCGQKNQKSEN